MNGFISAVDESVNSVHLSYHLLFNRLTSPMSHSGDGPVERVRFSDEHGSLVRWGVGTSEPHVLRKHPDLNVTLASYFMAFFRY